MRRTVPNLEFIDKLYSSNEFSRILINVVHRTEHAHLYVLQSTILVTSCNVLLKHALPMI